MVFFSLTSGVWFKWVFYIRFVEILVCEVQWSLKKVKINIKKVWVIGSTVAFSSSRPSPSRAVSQHRTTSEWTVNKGLGRWASKGKWSAHCFGKVGDSVTSSIHPPKCKGSRSLGRIHGVSRRSNHAWLEKRAGLAFPWLHIVHIVHHCLMTVRGSHWRTRVVFPS